MGWALGVLSLLHGMRGNAAMALPLFDRALAATTEQPTLNDLRLMLLINRAVALGDVDRYGEALEAADQARKLAEEAGNIVRLAQAESVLMELWFDIGNWDKALRQVEGRSRSIADPGVQCCDHGIAALIALHRNDPAAQRHLTEAERFATSLGRRLVGSLVLARSLDQEQAGASRKALAVILAGISMSATELSESISLLPDAVRLALVVGERTHAETLVEQAQAGGTSDVLHQRAVSNHCRGLFDNDPARLARAAQQYRRVGRLLPCAQAFEAAATAAADLGNASQARQYRATALSFYLRLHAGWDIARLSGGGRQAA
jgi:tetratricopeptide (TPR) repeat protein